MDIANESKMDVSISKLIKQVQNWPRDRWKYLSIGLISCFLALHMVSSSVPHLFSSGLLLDKIQIEKKPEELSTELWLVAEVRRSVDYQGKHNQLIIVSLIECVVGIMLGFGALYVLVPLIMHWKDGGQEIRLIRLLLECYKELEKNKSNVLT